MADHVLMLNRVGWNCKYMLGSYTYVYNLGYIIVKFGFRKTAVK